MPKERSAIIDVLRLPVKNLGRRHARRWRSPVGWLLDRQLLASLRNIFLYTAFGHRIDPRNWMAAEEIELPTPEGANEFWFDYLADTGDGTRATYSVAYLAYSQLWIPQAGAAAGCRVKLDEDPEHSRCLPRGAFLFVGGDTAYHVADYETLTERFQQPFTWAFNDLEHRGRVDAERRPLFAIPGNHDYYDFLDGFNRQFRRPFNPEQSFAKNEEGPQPLLVVPGFKRLQGTSYVALALPFGWRLWGIDAESGEMDRRQKAFFQRIWQDKSTDKLIVATPEPVTVFGRYRRAHHYQAEAFEDLKLERPFLRGQGESLPAGKARLDIAGDVHHYARYWGTTMGAAAEKGPRTNYASVVSGLGGAFLHASSTDIGEIRAKVRFPEPRTALAASIRRLMNVWNILQGGRVWMAGALVASIVFLGGLVSESPQRDVVAPLFKSLGFTVLAPATPGLPRGVLSAAQGSLKVPADTDRHWSNPELWYLPLLLAAVFLGILTQRRLKARSQRRGGEKSIRVSSYRWPVAVAVLAALASVVFLSIKGPGHYKTLKPLASNLVMLLLLAISFGGFYWSRQYDDAMYRQARLRKLNGWDQTSFLALFAFAVLTGIFGVMRYGVDSLAVVAVDQWFILCVLGTLLGLPFFAASTGAALHPRWGKVGFFFLGLWHGMLQLMVPLVLVVTRRWWQGLAAALVTAGITFTVGELVSRAALRDRDARDRFRVGALLLMIWLLLGAGLAVFAFTAKVAQRVNGPALLTATALGLVFSCIWFGWYLAVSLCFDGHNNEAGGGARIEQFKQFIRFRLTPEGLTGFVIGIDEPMEDGSKLKPRLIDVFEVRPGARNHVAPGAPAGEGGLPGGNLGSTKV